MQEDLPVDSNKVATIDKIKMWDYFGKTTAKVNANDNIGIFTYCL